MVGISIEKPSTMNVQIEIINDREALLTFDRNITGKVTQALRKVWHVFSFEKTSATVVSIRRTVVSPWSCLTQVLAEQLADKFCEGVSIDDITETSRDLVSEME